MAFLKKYTRKIVELSGNDGRSKVLLSADYQGRVMTSTASGDTGLSFGWLNHALISSGKKRKSFNPVGGEERFWLGPEGGQYSIYFKQGDSFTINNWQAFLRCGIRMGLILCKNAHRKNRLVTRANATTLDVEDEGCFVIQQFIVKNFLIKSI